MDDQADISTTAQVRSVQSHPQERNYNGSCTSHPRHMTLRALSVLPVISFLICIPSDSNQINILIYLPMVLACQVDECHVPATIAERAKSNVIMQCLVIAARAIT
jgi:hypothetical protein